MEHFSICLWWIATPTGRLLTCGSNKWAIQNSSSAQNKNQIQMSWKREKVGQEQNKGHARESLNNSFPSSSWGMWRKREQVWSADGDAVWWNASLRHGCCILDSIISLPGFQTIWTDRDCRQGCTTKGGGTAAQTDGVIPDMFLLRSVSATRVLSCRPQVTVHVRHSSSVLLANRAYDVISTTKCIHCTLLRYNFTAVC